MVDLTERENLRLTSTAVRQQVERRLSSGALEVADLAFETTPINTTPMTGRRVPIIPRVSYAAAPGYLLVDSLRLRPDSVTLSGATDALEEIDFWLTEPLDLEKLQRAESGKIDLVPSENGIRLAQPTVDYEVMVEAAIEKTIPVNIEVLHAPAGNEYRITPDRVNISVSVPQSAYDAVDPGDYTVVADLAEARAEAGRNLIPITILARPAQVRGEILQTKVVEYYLIK